MKFSLKGLISLIFSIILTASCVSDVMEPDNTPVQDGVSSYTAYTDGVDTKAVLDGKVSKWQGEETIALVGKNGTHKFAAYVDGVSSQATVRTMKLRCLPYILMQQVHTAAISMTCMCRM